RSAPARSPSNRARWPRTRRPCRRGTSRAQPRPVQRWTAGNRERRPRRRVPGRRTPGQSHPERSMPGRRPASRSCGRSWNDVSADGHDLLLLVTGIVGDRDDEDAVIVLVPEVEYARALGLDLVAERFEVGLAEFLLVVREDVLRLRLRTDDEADLLGLLRILVVVGLDDRRRDHLGVRV